jgi:signal peptidase
MFPFLVGADSSYEVTGGSMFPALKKGDIILNKGVDVSTINVGDVLTVNPGESVYTHRVVEKAEGGFRLKGDANEDPDPVLIEPSDILGKVIFVFPFSFLSTPYGFALTLLTPAVLIIGKQVHLIYKKNESSPLDTTTMLLLIIFILSITRIITPYFVGSDAYCSDSESASVNFQAGIWD